MRYLFFIFSLFIVASCARAKLMQDPDNFLYVNSQFGQVSEHIKYDGNLGDRGIVVIRLRIDAPVNSFLGLRPNDRVSGIFSTGEVIRKTTVYPGVLNRNVGTELMVDLEGQFVLTDSAHEERPQGDSDKRLWFKVDNNQFVAIALDPGTYTYEFAAKDFMEWAPTHSPNMLVQFSVASGEAKYVGDLVLSLDEAAYDSKTTIFGQKVVFVKDTVVDFHYEVSSDFSAAKTFYRSLKNKPDLKLEFELMTINEIK